MGAYNSTRLSSEEISELQKQTNFTRKEIEQLYHRFKKLDRNRAGFITSNDLHLIPEFSMNPMCHRIIALFDPEKTDQMTFDRFVQVLNVFSPKTSREDKLKFAFKIYDVDADGVVSESDLFHVLKSLVGSNLSDNMLRVLVTKTMETCLSSQSVGRGIHFQDFQKLVGDDVLTLNVQVQQSW